MKYKIVSDSSSDVLSLSGVNFASVPLKILCEGVEYVDDDRLDLEKMASALKATKNRTSTSCPNPNDWLLAFDDADCIFAITITSGLSGSYNSLLQAKDEYLELHPDAKIHTIDSLSTGPEMLLIIEKLKERILAGDSFEKISETIDAYCKRTHLLFSLQSLNNLANNGRVSHAAAKIAGILGIRMVGIADETGHLKLLDKCRGEKKTLTTIYEEMKNCGYHGETVRISHCFNPNAAKELEALIRTEYPDSDIKIRHCIGLCTYYAESGGLLVGFEA